MDEQILKTLESIEKLLRSSMAGSGGRMGGPSTSASRNDQSRKDKSDKDTNKTFSAIAKSTKDTSDALMGLNKSLVNLDTQVGRTSVGFGELQKQMSKFTGALGPMPATADPKTKPGAFSGLMGSITGIFKGKGSAKVNSRQADEMMGKAGGPQKSSTPAVGAGGSPFGAAGEKFVEEVAQTGVSLVGLGKVVNHLIDAGVELSRDFLSLAGQGLGSASNLGTLYLNAAQAGMSLKEYTALLDQNISVVSRSGSLDQFNTLISAADSQLAAMGVFGNEARQLQGNLAQASTVMGTSQGDLISSTKGMVDVFGELRKTVNITADQFSSMVTQLSKNEEVQKELVGLSPKERAARQQQIVQIASTGQRLGQTAEASAALSAALIAQRGATVQDSLDARGALMQAGAFLGQGDAGARAGELALKNNKTAAETEEFRKLIGQLDSGLQNVQQNGSLGARNVVDQIQAKFGTGGIQGIITANRGAQLSTESGQAGVNKDFGKSVGQFGQAVGEMLKWARGLQTSILGPVGAAIGGGALALLAKPIIGIAKTVTGIGGAASTASTLATAGKPGLVSINAATAAVGQGKPVLAGIAEAGSTVGKTLTTFGETFFAGIKTFSRFLGPETFGILDGVLEAFTGDLASTLNPSGGFFNRVMGVIESAVFAIPNAIGSIITYVFGEQFGSMIQNKIDIVSAMVGAGTRLLINSIISPIGDTLSWLLPKDSGLLKTIRGWSDGLKSGADENFAVVQKLSADGSLTTKKISDANKASADKATQAATAATSKQVAAQDAFNNVAYGTPTAMGIMADARAITGAQPQVQMPVAVTPPAAVNTPDAATTAAAAARDAATTAGSSSTDMMVVLNAMLLVMRDNLAAETKQAANSDALLRAVRPGAAFTDSEEMTTRILQQGIA